MKQRKSNLLTAFVLSIGFTLFGLGAVNAHHSFPPLM